jgi:hypothetical protein
LTRETIPKGQKPKKPKTQKAKKKKNVFHDLLKKRNIVVVKLFFLLRFKRQYPPSKMVKTHAGQNTKVDLTCCDKVSPFLVFFLVLDDDC